MVPNMLLSNDAKKQYLKQLLGKMFKILHLIEEEKETGFSPRDFISGQLFEVNSANELFEGKLVGIIVKLNGIYDNYANMSFDSIKRQIFEIKNIIIYINKELG